MSRAKPALQGKVYCFAILLTCASLSATAQEAAPMPGFAELTGFPPVTRYSGADYHSDSQFWTACENPEGFMFFGNNDGVLVFDGLRWQVVTLPNYSSVRSLHYFDGRMYVGGFAEFGYIRMAPGGLFSYHSLVDSLGLKNELTDMVWHIASSDGRMCIRQFNQLIVIDNFGVTQIPATVPFTNSFALGEHYVVQDESLDLYMLNAESLTVKKLLSSAQVGKTNFTTILKAPAERGYIGVGKEGQLWYLSDLWSSPKATPRGRLAVESTVISACNGAGSILIGDIRGHLYKLEFSHADKPLTHSFIPDLEASVLHIFQSRDGNIWALLNNGLAYVNCKAAYSRIFSKASVYSMAQYKGTLLLGTNQGLYSCSMAASTMRGSDSSFVPVKGMEGQVWKLVRIDSTLFICHDRGLFTYSDAGITRVGRSTGIWKVIVPEGHANVVLACTYNGMYRVSRDSEGQWREGPYVEGIDFSVRDIAQISGENSFWICHGYQGVYRVWLSGDLSAVSSLQYFNALDGLPSMFGNNVVRWRDSLLFTTNEGLYRYADSKGSFERHTSTYPVLSAKVNYRYLRRSGSRAFVVKNDALGYFWLDSTQAEGIFEPFEVIKGSLNRGLECIEPMGDSLVLVGTTHGLYRFDLRSSRHQMTPSPVIRKFYSLAWGNSEALHPRSSAATALDQGTERISFAYAQPGYSAAHGLVFSTYLEGYDTGWTAWSDEASRSFDRLPSGAYTFAVRSKSHQSPVSNATLVSFRIPPMWYDSSWARIGFALLLMSALFACYQLIMHRIASVKKRERAKAEESRRILQLEIAQLRLNAEKEEINSKRARLQADVLSKSKELAHFTMQLVHKKELFGTVKAELKELRKVAGSEGLKRRLTSLYDKVAQGAVSEQYMEAFDVNFEQIHEHFFKELNQRHGQFTNRELRLCAFIRMDLSNKEIAPLLNISVRGVESARYRLRKRMQLEHDVSLSSYLSGFGEQAQDQ